MQLVCVCVCVCDYVCCVVCVFIFFIISAYMWFKQKFIQDEINIQKIIMCSSTSYSYSVCEM